MNELFEIQKVLCVPKNRTNDGGGFRYRSCEDILTAVKPHLKTHGLILTLSDDVVQVGDRYYVKAIATVINDSNETISTTAFAREPNMQEAMKDGQITGAASSYARKYALCGLFAIDDEKDPDVPRDAEPKQTGARRKGPIKPQPEMP